MSNKGDLKVWWIPQVPGKPFEVSVSSVAEGAKLVKVLADYDLFQYKNKIKPDYCNAGGLVEFDGEYWSDWYSEEGESLDDWVENQAETSE